MPRQFTLGKNERLKSRKRIDFLFDHGSKLLVNPYRIFYNWRQIDQGDVGAEPLQAGFGASSRHFKTAVARNRIKRLTREAYRLQKNELKQVLVQQNQALDVFFIYTGKDMPVYQQVYESMGIIIKKLVNASVKKN